MHSTQALELYPDYSVTQVLFKDVKNALELRQSAVEGKFTGALISPTLVMSPFQDEAPPLSEVVSQVNGLQVPVSDLSSLSDSNKIKKFFKITPQEEKIGPLLDAVVCRMAIKDVL